MVNPLKMGVQKQPKVEAVAPATENPAEPAQVQAHPWALDMGGKAFGVEETKG